MTPTPYTPSTQHINDPEKEKAQQAFPVKEDLPGFDGLARMKGRLWPRQLDALKQADACMALNADCAIAPLAATLRSAAKANFFFRSSLRSQALGSLNRIMFTARVSSCEDDQE